MALLEGDEIIVTYHPSEHNVFPGWYGKIREQCDHQRRSWVEAEGMEAPNTQVASPGHYCHEILLAPGTENRSTAD